MHAEQLDQGHFSLITHHVIFPLGEKSIPHDRSAGASIHQHGISSAVVVFQPVQAEKLKFAWKHILYELDLISFFFKTGRSTLS